MADVVSEVHPAQGDKKPTPKCYPKWRGKPVFDGNKEAIGWTLVSVALLINYVGVGAFFATTILRLAVRATQCHATNADKDIDLNELCGPAITFIKPSSLLTFYAMIIGSVTALSLPFLGAIVDYTRHRLLLGRITSFMFTVFLFPLIFLNEKNYIIILACHGLSIFFSWFVTTFYFAYLPELTSDELKLADWTKCITMWSYGGMCIYLAGIVGGVYLLGRTGDDIYTTRIGMGVMFGIDALLLQIAWWFCFGKREPLHTMPENSSLCTVGFKQLFTTGAHIYKNYSSLKWYYLHVTFANSGWQSFGIVTLAYLTYFLEFTPLRTAIAFGCSLLCSIPGATFSTFVARKLDPIRAARINMVILIFTIVVFALILNGPGQYTRTNLYFAFIGFNGGWKVTMDRLISSTIIPDDQSTEMMGFFLFADQWLLWLPLLVYTMLNEAGVAPQINVIILSSYLCVSLLFLCMTGSYATARAEVNRDSVYMDKDAAAAAAAAATSSDVDATVGAKDDEKAGDEESSPTVQAEETLAEA